jgi:hypothetical protein
MRKVVNFLLIGILGFGLLAFAQQEVPPGRIVIEFWHAFRGALGDLTQQMIDKFNQSQDKTNIGLWACTKEAIPRP